MIYPARAHVKNKRTNLAKFVRLFLVLVFQASTTRSTLHFWKIWMYIFVWSSWSRRRIRFLLVINSDITAYPNSVIGNINLSHHSLFIQCCFLVIRYLASREDALNQTSHTCAIHRYGTDTAQQKHMTAHDMRNKNEPEKRSHVSRWIWSRREPFLGLEQKFEYFLPNRVIIEMNGSAGVFRLASVHIGMSVLDNGHVKGVQRSCTTYNITELHINNTDSLKLNVIGSHLEQFREREFFWILLPRNGPIWSHHQYSIQSSMH